MRAREFRTKLNSLLRKAERLPKEASLAYLRSLEEARDAYDEAIMLTMNERMEDELRKVKKRI